MAIHFEVVPFQNPKCVFSLLRCFRAAHGDLIGRGEMFLVVPSQGFCGMVPGQTCLAQRELLANESTFNEQQTDDEDR